MRAKPLNRYAVDCSTVVRECAFRARGEDSDEAAQSLLAHVKDQHEVAVTSDMVARVRAAVRRDAG